MTKDTATPLFHQFADENGNVVYDMNAIITWMDNALDGEAFHDVINQSIPWIQLYHEQIVHILKRRVIAWQSICNPSNELHEGARIVRLAPHDPYGYLCVGKRFAEQGRQTKAIQFFDQGLRLVPPTDAKYKEIYDARQRAVVQRMSHVDIIDRVPFDIMGIIASYIPFETLVECLDVSPQWRQKLSSYPGCWSNVCVDSKQPTNAYRALSVVYPHVRHLSIPNSSQSGRYITLIRGNHFKSLNSLVVQPLDYDDKKKQDHVILLCTCLPSIAESLTSLKISLGVNTSITLAQVLATCRNLVTLSFEETRGVTAFADIILPHQTLLEKVFLRASKMYTNQHILSSHLVPLFQRSPHIWSLAVCGADDDIYRVVAEHCPSIINFSSIFYEAKFDSNGPSDSSSHGLRNLSVDSVNHSGSSLAPLLDKYSATLRNLYARILLSEGGAHLFGLRHLTTLRLDFLSAEVIRQLPTLLENCTELTYVGLSHSHQQIQGPVFDALSKLKKLATLLLAEVDIAQEAMVQFLKSHATQRNEASKLMDFTLSATSYVYYYPILIASTNIATLEFLNFEFNEENPVVTNDTDKFAIAIGQLPRLRYLRLSSLYLSPGNLLQISASKSLRKVEFYCVYGVSEHQALSAFPRYVTVSFTDYEG